MWKIIVSAVVMVIAALVGLTLCKISKRSDVKLTIKQPEDDVIKETEYYLYQKP